MCGNSVGGKSMSGWFLVLALVVCGKSVGGTMSPFMYLERDGPTAVVMTCAWGEEYPAVQSQIRLKWLIGDALSSSVYITWAVKNITVVGVGENRGPEERTVRVHLTAATMCPHGLGMLADSDLEGMWEYFEGNFKVC